MKVQIDLSIVIPIFNEEDGITQFLSELRETLLSSGYSYEVLAVDDGSSDATVQNCLMMQWPQLKILSLTRNFGHQSAMMAGLEQSRGEYVITMDGDGQHPPKLVIDLMEVAKKNNAKVVYTKRANRSNESHAKKLPALLYYKIIRMTTGIYLEDSQADFRLIHRDVLNEVMKIHGQQILRVLIPQMGFRSARINYATQDRIAGTSKYQFRRQISMVTSSVLNYSSQPLRLLASAGMIVSFMAMIWLIYVVGIFVTGQSVDGWASVMFAVLVIGGMLLIGLSLVGSYIARIYDIVKGTPQYVIESKTVE